MKITVLTQNFAPEMGATAVRLYELTTRLAARGHSVTVIAPMPNYPTGRVFDGYRGRLRLEEEMSGVRVVRTWVRPSESANPFPRLLTYLSFVSSSMVAGLARAWPAGRCDVRQPAALPGPGGAGPWANLGRSRCHERVRHLAGRGRSIAVADGRSDTPVPPWRWRSSATGVPTQW